MRSSLAFVHGSITVFAFACGLFGVARAQGGPPLARPNPKPTVPLASPLPSQTGALLVKAKEALRSNHVSEAIAALEQAAVADPNNPEIYLILGDVYLAAQRYDAAATALERRVALVPKDARAYLRLGQTLYAAKHYAAAVNALKSAVALDPGDVEKLVTLGGALEDDEKYRDAQTAFARAEDIRPDDVRIRMNLANVFLREKDYDSARGALIEALGFAPDNAEVHEALGNLDEQENRHQEALDEFDAALRINRKSIEARMGRASALAGLKRYDEAVYIMRGIVGELPSDPSTQAAAAADAHSGLAQVLDSAGKHAEAVSEYDIALKLSPNGAILWGNLGWAQYNQGDYAGAEKSSRKALDIDPKLSYVRLNLGLLYAVQNRWADSQKAYRDAIAISAAADIRAAIGDVRDAIAAHPTHALRLALDFLNSAERKSVGLPE